MLIKDLMTSTPKSCGPSATAEEIAAIMWNEDCGAVPVINDAMEPIGIVTDRDIAMSMMLKHRAPNEVSAEELIGDRMLFVTREDDTPEMALDIMRTERIRRLPVVDFDNKLCGMLSFRDLCRSATKRRNATVSYEDIAIALQQICEPYSIEMMETA